MNVGDLDPIAWIEFTDFILKIRPGAGPRSELGLLTMAQLKRQYELCQRDAEARDRELEGELQRLL